MHSTRRSSLWGAEVDKIVIVTILLMMALISHVGYANITLKNEKHKLNETINEKNGAIVTLRQEKDNLNTYISQVQTENNQLKEEIDKHDTELLEMQQEIDSILKSSTPIGGAFKSYTDYKCLSKSSAQWKLQQQAYTDENGLRKIGDAYLVALGSYYGTKLGTEYIVTLSTGNTFRVMLCDQKDDSHTNESHQVTKHDGSILEFYVDSSRLNRKAKITGTISSISFFAGEVISIVRIS